MFRCGAGLTNGFSVGGGNAPLASLTETIAGSGPAKKAKKLLSTSRGKRYGECYGGMKETHHHW